MKESKASAAMLCLFWGKPLEEKHEPTDKTAATPMQGLGKVSWDERWKHLQLRGQERFERRHADAFQMCKKPSPRGRYGFHICEE